MRVALKRKKGTNHAFDGEERSQRTRGFLFQALGAVTAHAAGVNSLIVPENGIGAINLPYVESQYGTQSVSCDKFPQRLKHAMQCGRCTSCLLRRQSLSHAGLSQHDLGASYAADIAESGCNTDDKKWYHYRVMADQVERLDAALSNASPEIELVNSFPALAEQFLLLRETSLGGNVRPLIDLYRRYCAEWRTFHERRSESPLADHVHDHG